MVGFEEDGFTARASGSFTWAGSGSGSAKAAGRTANRAKRRKLSRAKERIVSVSESYSRGMEIRCVRFCALISNQHVPTAHQHGHVSPRLNTHTHRSASDPLSKSQLNKIIYNNYIVLP